MVRHQPSKLIFVGSNPISRSQFGVPVSSVSVSRDAGALDTEILKKRARGAAVSAGDS